MKLPADMPPEELQRWGRTLIDWIVDYLSHPERYPVLARVEPGQIGGSLPAGPPVEGEPMEEIFRDFQETILPGVTHWNHPSFHAYFAISASGPGILGELLMSALNVNAMMWRTSPSATELEERVLDWLRQMLGLPEPRFGIIYDTASIGSLCALAAAREGVPGLEVREQGLAGNPDARPLRVYVTEQTHSSIDKACLLLGLGKQSLRRIPLDTRFRMDPGALAHAIEEDRASGSTPLAVVATVGSTSTTAIDPVPAVAEVCAREAVWLHVDAAYGGSAALVPEMKWVLDGCESADSLIVNPHKWLFTPLDISVLYCRRPEVLRNAFRLVPEYLKSSDAEAVTNFMDYGVQLGRRFRALKLWMVLRYFGTEGMAERIREHLRLAQNLASWIDGDPDFERMAPTPLSTVCFRARPRSLEGRAPEEIDLLNEALLESVNATGQAFLSHTRIHDRYSLRLVISNLRTEHRHVEAAWRLLREHAHRLVENKQK